MRATLGAKDKKRKRVEADESGRDEARVESGTRRACVQVSTMPPCTGRQSAKPMAGADEQEGGETTGN